MNIVVNNAHVLGFDILCLFLFAKKTGNPYMMDQFTVGAIHTVSLIESIYAKVSRKLLEKD